MNISVKVDLSKLNVGGIASALKGDKLGTFAAMEWHRLYQKYVPEESGTMYNTVSIEPWKITHTSPYAHYQYEGRVMGPNYPINGGEAFFSPKGKPKYYTGKSLQYRKAGACSHWDQMAAATEGTKLADAVGAYIAQGKYL